MQHQLRGILKENSFLSNMSVCVPHIVGWSVTHGDGRSLCLLPPSYRSFHPDEGAPVGLFALCFVCHSTPRPTHYMTSNHKPLCTLKPLQSTYIWMNEWMILFWLLTSCSWGEVQAKAGDRVQWQCVIATLCPSRDEEDKWREVTYILNKEKNTKLNYTHQSVCFVFVIS